MDGPPLRAAAIHVWFGDQVGSEHIATRFAVAGLIRWLGRTRPERILEIGSGIGTLTYTVLRWALDTGRVVALTCVEPDSFCRETLARNLERLPLKPHVFSRLEDAAPPPEGYDLVIVDGGSTDPALFRHLAPRAIVFVEGGRENQRQVLETAQPARTWTRACFFSLPRRLAGKKSAYWVYRFEPRRLERMRFGFARAWDAVGYRMKRTWARVAFWRSGSRTRS